ncbi:MAG: hypothetical protein M0Z84_14665 [Gammaproteobacteria bacterium]|nr:hypothetical protein [Gammaproteobacteria bacterium]
MKTGHFAQDTPGMLDDAALNSRLRMAFHYVPGVDGLRIYRPDRLAVNVPAISRDRIGFMSSK